MSRSSAPITAAMSAIKTEPAGSGKNSVEILSGFRSGLDETEKFLYALSDGNVVEGVLLRYPHGDNLCVSTQVGCRMGCVFCASTLNGLVRNLTPEEMAGQIEAVNRLLLEWDTRRRVHNIVLMGSGEPLDNYENVMSFLRSVSDPDGIGLPLRQIALSTCGLAERIRSFAKEGLPVHLCLSLHAPNDEIRRRLMPSAAANSYEELLAACRYYADHTGRRVTMEYALIRDVNSGVRHAEELAWRLHGMNCHVNLIPLNSVTERELYPPKRETVEAFRACLRSRGVSVTVRRELGADIEGACGQLRRKILGIDA